MTHNFVVVANVLMPICPFGSGLRYLHNFVEEIFVALLGAMVRNEKISNGPVKGGVSSYMEFT